MQKIVNCLWFNNQAEEAANFYTAVFKNGKIGRKQYYDEETAKATGQKAGSLLTIEFSIEGQEFMALNGGPVFNFTPAISLLVSCKNQAEVDLLWSNLSADPAAEQCGWLKDKFGLSWQIVPAELREMTHDRDKKRSSRVMAALMKMKKLDLEALRAAFDGKELAGRRN